MKTFSVIVQTATGRISYSAIAERTVDVLDAAYDRFGLCGVTVIPCDSLLGWVGA